MRLTGSANTVHYQNGRLIIDCAACHEDDLNKIIKYMSTGKKISIDIKREKRSLDANAYLWELLGKLARKLSNDGVVYTPEQVYRHAIRQTGEPTYVPIKKEAVDAFKRVWRADRIGRIAEVVSKSKLPGYMVVAVYKGSSEYDSKEMSRLIDFVVEECKLQGVETQAPQYLNRLLNEWGGYNGRNDYAGRIA